MCDEYRVYCKVCKQQTTDLRGLTRDLQKRVNQLEKANYKLTDDIGTRELVDALQEREDVSYIVNTRTSRTCVASIQGDDMLVETGEHIILLVKGLY